MSKKATKSDKLKPKEVPNGPFPRAQIVRIIRANAPDHIISWRVKNAMNFWLGEISKNVAKRMGKSRYSTLDLDDFNEAIKRYQIADELDAEKERLLKGLEKVQLDIDALKRDIERRILTREEQPPASG
ncbi:MAG: hypothetical protein ABH829_04515 [archaeon]